MKTDVEIAVADAHRREWAYVLAATVRVAGDIDLAEECVQDAYARALARWPIDGIPINKGAWLTTVARRRAIDLRRRSDTLGRLLPMLSDDESESVPEESDTAPLSDDRLRLIFTCCHPALSDESQIALTLRLVCGLTTNEVSRALLVSESTMAARITRAKKKIAAAHIPYSVPSTQELPARIEAVLTVVHLLFTSGHTAAAGDQLVRRDLVERALELARMLRVLLPEHRGVAGLLALILLTDSRRETRVGPDGQLILLSDQERSKWDHVEIAEGVALVRVALRPRPPDRFALMAAVAAVHAEAPTWDATDWTEIVGLYDVLSDIWPSPIVALNRAVAVGFAHGPQAGLDEIEVLATDPTLSSYSYLASSRAEFLHRLGRNEEATLAFEEALAFCDNTVERNFLMLRIAKMERLGRGAPG
ncbi:MAG: sigma-70 family RNA polymerase sigma factor [Acidimicrobiales bacterium]